MKSINESELNILVESLKPFEGAQLQQVLTHESDIVLGFYRDGQVEWVWLDFHARRLSILPMTELKVRFPKQTKPMTLFLKKNFVGLRLHEVSVLKKFGRVIEMVFSSGDAFSVLQARLFPMERNLIANAASGKTLSLFKANPLEEIDSPHVSNREDRTMEEIRDDWHAARSTGKSTASKGAATPEQKIKKLEKAKTKIEQQIEKLKQNNWKAMGDWISAKQTLDVPEEFSENLDSKLSMGEHIQFCYEKHKQALSKIEGGEARLEELNQEIQGLRSGEIRTPKQPKANLMSDSSAKGRRVAVGEWTLNLGLSAKENLKLIRKAKPWHLWLHMRDMPGAHGVIDCQKKQQVPESMQVQAAKALVEFQFRRKLDSIQGEKFEVMVAEIRHVRPIKGDKAGRVHYQNERTLIVQI